MRERKRRVPYGRPIPIFALALALLSAVCALAQSTPVVARAAGVTGQAILLTPGLAPFALTAGYILTPGDRIDTRGGGRVVIDLSDGSMVVVSPESVVTLKDYRAAASLRELFGITLGMVRVKINHFAGKPNPYRMNSPTASIAVRGTEFNIEVDVEGSTQVVVFEGSVEVVSLSNPERRVLIEAGRGVLVQGGQDFRLIGANLAPPASRDVAERSGRDRAKPVQVAGLRTPEPHSDDSEHSSGPTPQTMSGSLHDEQKRDETPRATASTYDRYLAGLNDIGQVPFLFRFNAYPEAHLDSLENPAYASEFRSAEGRLFILPTFRGARTLEEYQSAFGPGGSLPSDYSFSPQVSFFAPLGKFTLGGSASVSHVGNSSATVAQHFESGEEEEDEPESTVQTNGTSRGTFYSGALVLARRAGRNSFGVELASLKGTGSISSVISETTESGRPIEERSESTSNITQTRLTAGFSRDLPHNVKLGLFYRYAFIRGVDQDVAHTSNGLPLGLNSARTAGHSSELGLRLRGRATPRLSYGFAASWLGISLLDGLNRIGVVDSHERDRARRGTVAVGLGYALSRRTTLSFDLAGGSARTWAARSEDATRALLQDASGRSHFVSTHAAVQRDVTSRLFLTASFLNVWQANTLNLNVFPDRYGTSTNVEDAFFPMNPTATRYAPRYSDFGAGWRFSGNLFVQYVYSTDYGTSSATHSLMLRYTFHRRD